VSLNQTSHLLNNKSAFQIHKNLLDRPLRVVTYTDAAGIGGAEISLSHLIATVSDNIDVTVLGTSQHVVNAIAALRPQASRLVLPATGLGSASAHFTALRRLRPDVVHVNLCTPWVCTTVLFAALTLPNVRVVRVDQLHCVPPIALWRNRMLSLRVDAHVAVGAASARRMEDFYALGRGTVISIPNCVPDVGAKSPSVQPDGHIIVGSVGRLDLMKAHDILLRAIAKVAGVRVVILGEGEQRPALEKLAVDLGVSDRIGLLGWVDDSRAYLHEFDVIALPSRSEGFPLAVVEAMLAARPVVATRVGSVSEAVTDDETGILIDKDDIDGLATALCRLRDDPALRAQLGKRGREVAIAHFTVEQMTANYERLWYKLVTAPQAPRLRLERPRD
jgi:glycosyltransferase involved in cell wall biosynthesis